MTTSPNTIATELGFPHPTLTFLAAGVAPSPKLLRLLKREVCANPAAIDSPQGGGNHGHLGYVMPAAAYAALTGGGAAWADPVRPLRPVIGAGTSAVVMQNTQTQFEEEKAIHETFRKFSTTIKALLLAAILKTYINALADDLHGFNNVTPLDILNHLETTYGAITTEHLGENEALLKTPWDPTTATEIAFDNANAVLAFATLGQEPIADGKAIRMLVKVFQDSAVMDDAVKDWKKKTPANQTLANLRTHMHTYNQRRLRAVSAEEAGYRTANAVAPPTDPSTIQALIDGAVARALAAQANGSPTSNAINAESLYYCWTHGLGRDTSHTSSTCNSRAEGHQATATADNMMGGNNQIRRRRNERPVCRRQPRNNNE